MSFTQAHTLRLRHSASERCLSAVQIRSDYIRPQAKLCDWAQARAIRLHQHFEIHVRKKTELNDHREQQTLRPSAS